MVAAELAMLSIAHPIAGVVAVVWFLRCYKQLGKWQQQQREDRHYADVRAWREHADEQTVTLRPVDVVRREPLTAWRPALPGETPGTVEPDDAPAPQWTAGRHHYAGDVYADRHNHRPLHAADDSSDALMRALVTKTQAMFVRALTAAGETPPDTFGPPEPMMRRIVWDPSQPEVWRQESLPIEAAS